MMDMSKKENIQIKNDVESLLFEMNVTPDKPYFMRVRDALLRAYELYPGKCTLPAILDDEILKYHNTTLDSYRDSFKRTINDAWTDMSEERECDVFGVSVGHKPTVIEFIRLICWRVHDMNDSQKLYGNPSERNIQINY